MSMDIRNIISEIKGQSLTSAISEFQKRKRDGALKPLAYTSFDGGYMPFLSNILTYTVANGFLPINPESALGYYVSTTTHQGNKVLIMEDCLCEELLCDEMWIFDSVTGHMPEGVVAEIMAWKDEKGTSIRKIPFFNGLKVNLKTNQADAALNDYIMTPIEIFSFLENCNPDDIGDIRKKLFDASSHIPQPAYVVANFHNYKHLDWARSYCYQHSICPVSPQNILPYSLYATDCAVDCELHYVIDRLTLMDKCHELLWFTNTKNLKYELEKLDVFSCTELFYWYTVYGPVSIKVVDWADAGVPKYKNNNTWALTRTELNEVQPTVGPQKGIDFSLVREKIFAYEKEINDDFNIFKGGLLAPEECSFIMNDMNAFLFGLISDSSVKAELAWSLPYRLKNRLHHFDLNIIADMDVEELTSVIKTKPALHRYPSNIAKYIKSAAQLLISPELFMVI